MKTPKIAVQEFFAKRENQKEAAKYCNDLESFQKLAQKLVDALTASKRIPCAVSAGFCWKELVESGKIRRIDGGDERSDFEAEVAESLEHVQEAMEEVDALGPVNAQELEYFASLHPEAVSQMYWQDDAINSFAVRFNKYVAAGYYTVPPRPITSATGASSNVRTRL